MAENISQSVSLVGHVIEDLTYVPLGPSQFEARLVEAPRLPQYKEDGFFVFSDLRPGNYTLQILGEGFQPQTYDVTLPFAPLILDPPGDDELVVIAKTINGGGKKITFDPVILSKEIRAGAPVRAAGFSATLAADLDAGRITEARLDTVAGLVQGAIVRIVRDKSIRLKFNPYYQFPSERSRIVGTAVLNSAPEIYLAAAQVRLTKVNGVNLVLTDVAGARIATVDINGTKIVLGAEKDIATLTNQNGDYNLYFSKGDFLQNVTLEATLTGYQPAIKTEPISPGQRKRIDFQLTRV